MTFTELTLICEYDDASFNPVEVRADSGKVVIDTYAGAEGGITIEFTEAELRKMLDAITKHKGKE